MVSHSASQTQSAMTSVIITPSGKLIPANLNDPDIDALLQKSILNAISYTICPHLKEKGHRIAIYFNNQVTPNAVKNTVVSQIAKRNILGVAILVFANGSFPEDIDAYIQHLIDLSK